MAHFAKLDENNVVIFVTVGAEQDDGKENQLSIRTGDVYKQTSYNTRRGVYYTPNTDQPDPDQSKAYRKNYAGIGYVYDETLDAFIPPKPYPSWTLDSTTADWIPPIPMPDDGQRYFWNEATQSWDLVDVPTA